MDRPNEKIELMREAVSLLRDIKNALNANTSSHMESPKKNDGKGAI